MNTLSRTVFLVSILVLSTLSAALALSVWINEGPTVYAGIQAAVDNASSGDYINISTGTFYECVWVRDVDIALVGGYDETTITKLLGAKSVIDGTGAVHALHFQSSTSYVSDLSVVHGSNWGSIGGGCYAQDAMVYINSSDFCSNRSLWGGGVGVSVGSYVELTNGCRVFANDASGGGGVYVGGSLLVRDDASDIFQNTASNYGGGILAYQARLQIHDGDVYYNRVDTNVGCGGGIMLWDTTWTALLYDVTLSYNDACNGGGLYATNSDCLMDTPAIGYNEATECGGGFYGVEGDFVLEDPWIFDNRAGDSGGGLIVQESDRLVIRSSQPFDPLVTRVRISDNRCGSYGGGIGCWSTPVHIESAHILTNRSDYESGGVHGFAFTMYHTPMSVSNCLFAGNTASNDAGGLCIWGYEAALAGADFENNTAGRNGGAIKLYTGSMRLNDGRFYRNTAASTGGAIFAHSADTCHVAQVTGPWYSPTSDWPLLFRENSAYVAGAIAMMECNNGLINLAAFITNASQFIAAIFTERSGCDVLNSLFAHNSANLGIAGAVHYSISTGTVFECTFMSNRPSGVSSSVGRMDVRNCIVWGSPYAQITNYNRVSTADYCCIENGDIAGTGNFSADPRLYPNYHLRAGSPCINATPFGSAFADIDHEYRFNIDDIGFDEWIDGDGDALPDIVETDTGTWAGEDNTGTDPADADSDDDGNPDGAEWYADTDPNNADQSLEFVRVVHAAGQVAFTWKGGTSAWQVLEWDTTLKGDNWTPMYTNVPSPVTPVTNTVGVLGQTSPFLLRIRAYR
ncbi:MAG: hypothetical protein JXB04_10995 [Kiritimatiellae bacterium]|nr:hypothetical protein [Kiritimatiellia bacterium]